MSFKILLLSLALLFCFSALVIADGGFYGSVTYGGNGCGWHVGDQVTVYRVSTGESGKYYIVQQGPGYNTLLADSLKTWPAGHYHISVTHYDSPCGPAVIQEVDHGTTDQQVNLIVLGPGDPGNGPGQH